MDERVKNFGMIERGRRRKTGTVSAVYRSGDGFRVVCDTHHESTSRELRNEAMRALRDPSLFCSECEKKSEQPRTVTTVDDLRSTARSLKHCDVGEHRAANVTTYAHEDGGNTLDCCARCAKTKRGRSLLDGLNAELKRTRQRQWKGKSKQERERLKKRITSQAERNTFAEHREATSAA